MIEHWPSPRRQTLAWPWMLTLCSLIMLALRITLEAGLGGVAANSAGQWGFVPTDVMGALSRPPAEWMHGDVAGLFTALFVHGDWLHLAGNLAYLWVFGVTVERALGPWGLAASFLVLGALANLVLGWQTAESTTPVIGASGGVSALIGIYLGLFPVSRMGLWLPLGLYLQFARVPALLVIGSWFALQLIYTAFGSGSDTVAWWAHVAGFVAGVLLAVMLRPILGRTVRQLQED